MNSIVYRIIPSGIAAAILPTLLLVTFLAGCFGPPGVKDLEVRARQYMEERQKRDWVAVYDKFLDPDLRLEIPRDAFLQRRSGAYDLLSFSVDSATVEPGESNGGSRTIRRELVDSQSWVVREGQWYVRLKR